MPRASALGFLGLTPGLNPGLNPGPNPWATKNAAQTKRGKPSGLPLFNIFSLILLVAAVEALLDLFQQFTFDHLLCQQDHIFEGNVLGDTVTDDHWFVNAQYGSAAIGF